MQKWAYCRLVVENIGQSRVPTVSNRSIKLNGIKEPTMPSSLDDWMDCLGRNGWELVGVMSNGDVGHLLFRTPD